MGYWHDPWKVSRFIVFVNDAGMIKECRWFKTVNSRNARYYEKGGKLVDLCSKVILEHKKHFNKSS